MNIFPRKEIDELSNNRETLKFQITDFSIGEIILVGTTIAGGILACAIPAYQAYKLDISKTLAHE